MMTVKQVSKLTGVSVRALQFYDEIGLLKPTQITEAGYRLYDEKALERLRQTLFFKELDFTLREIKGILEDPGFDQAAAFQKQRELIRLKRDRLNRLLGLLDRLMKGEKSVDFKEFDMSEYIRVLEEFKRTRGEDIVRRYGSMEQFDAIISAAQAKEGELAGLAVKQYGSAEAFAKAMETNLRDFLDNGPRISREEAGALVEKTDLLTKRVTADLARDPADPEVQKALGELMAFVEGCSRGMDMGEGYWSMMADRYSGDELFIRVTDKKYGEGASSFLGRAIRACLDRREP